MKEYRAIAKNVRSSVQKAKIPADVVRGMLVSEAIPVLTYMNKKAAGDVLKVVKSAAANAVHNGGIKTTNLYIAEIKIDKGLQFRRMRAGSRGSPKFFALHHSHISVTLKENEEKNIVKEDKVVEEKEKKETPKSVKKVSTKKKNTKEKSE